MMIFQYLRGWAAELVSGRGLSRALLCGLLAVEGWALPLTKALPGATLGPAAVVTSPLTGCVGSTGFVGSLVAADDDPGLVLNAVAAELSVTYRGRKTDAGAIDERITPLIRTVLNTWAETARDLKLNIAVPESAEALVIGTVDVKTMDRAADVLDETWELLEPLMAEHTRRPGDAVLVLLFDGAGFRSEIWPEVLDQLVSCGIIDRATRSGMRYAPGGLTIFSGEMFIQPAFDQAGDKSAGDDEFRLDNELAHKLTVSLLRSRFGQVPECMRWGLGYVAEQRLFQSIYQFNRAGFVAVEEHFDWPDVTRDRILKLRKSKKGLRLPEMVTFETAAGKYELPQMLTWGALDYLLDREPEVLAELLTELADLHDQAARYRAVSSYVGADEATKAALEKHLGALDAKQLGKHLKRVK